MIDGADVEPVEIELKVLVIEQDEQQHGHVDGELQVLIENCYCLELLLPLPLKRFLLNRVAWYVHVVWMTYGAGQTAVGVAKLYHQGHHRR